MGSIALTPSHQRILNVKQTLGAALNRIQLGLPAYLTDTRRKGMAERINGVMITIAGQKGMEKVTPESFAKAAVRLAQIALDPDPVLGQAYLIPFGDQLQIIVGYRGYLELAWRSERVLDIRADVVWPEDDFVYRSGTKLILEHTPNLNVDHTGQSPIAAYAIADLKGGGQVAVVLPRWKIEQYKNRSSAVQTAKRINAQKRPGEKMMETPWDTDPEAMFRKTAIRRLAAFIPQSADIFRGAFINDEDVDPRERKGVMDVAFEAAEEVPSGEPVRTLPTSAAQEDVELATPVSTLIAPPLTIESFSKEDYDRLIAAAKAAGAIKTKAQLGMWLQSFKGTPEEAIAYWREQPTAND